MCHKGNIHTSAHDNDNDDGDNNDDDDDVLCEIVHNVYC